MRYLRQPHYKTCGPTVVVNAAKWAGHRASRSTLYKELTDRFKTVKIGTSKSEFEQMLGMASGMFKATWEPEPSVMAIDRALRKGQAVILKYNWQVDWEIGAHFTLVVGKRGRDYVFINDGWETTEVIRPRKAMNRRLKGIEHLRPMVWYVEKK